MQSDSWIRAAVAQAPIPVRIRIGSGNAGRSQVEATSNQRAEVIRHRGSAAAKEVSVTSVFRVSC